MDHSPVADEITGGTAVKEEEVFLLEVNRCGQMKAAGARVILVARAMRWRDRVGISVVSISFILCKILMV